MNLVKTTLVSATALMMGVSIANADMILREDASGNKVVVNTETEKEARLYGIGGDNSRPGECEAGAFYTMKDKDREVYRSCDDEKMMFSARADASTSSSAAASSSTAGASTSATVAPGATASADQPLEPYTSDTIGSN